MRLVGTSFGCVSWLLKWIIFYKWEVKFKEFSSSWSSVVGSVQMRKNRIRSHGPRITSVSKLHTFYMIFTIMYNIFSLCACCCRPGKLPPQLTVFQLIHINMLKTLLLSYFLFTSISYMFTSRPLVEGRRFVSDFWTCEL